MVSVIIPTYNRASTIKASIMSVLNQSYTDLELIIVDDGSSDDTETIVNCIADARIRYHKLEKNSGACVARNTGIRLALGSYIAFQDSDDTWRFDKIEKQLKHLLKTDADMVYCGMTRIINGRSKYYPDDQRNNEPLSLQTLLAKNKVSTQNILIKKDVAEKILFDPTFKRLQDWDFVTRVMIYGFRIEYLAEPLTTANVRNDSITSRVNAEESYLHFIDKYFYYYQQFPKALGSTYYTLSCNVTSKLLRIKYLLRSFILKPSLKTIIKLFAVGIGI